MLSGMSQQQRGAIYGVTAYLVWAGLLFVTLDNLRRIRKLRPQRE